MRKIGMLTFAGFAFLGLLAACATDATAQAAQGGDFPGAAFGGTAIPYSPRVDIPYAPVSFAGFPGRVTGTGEDPEAKTSFTAVALQALAGAKWMITRHIGLFFDYKFRTADPSFNILNATSDIKLNINHIFGGVALHF